MDQFGRCQAGCGSPECREFDVGLDDSDIRVGVLLGKELLKAIEASRAVVLIWSEAAKNSASVTTEILAAFHLNRFILPYNLDATEFPQLLSRSIHGDLRKERATALTKLAQDAKRAPRFRNEFPGVTAYQPAELEKTIRELNDAQMAVLDRVGANDLVDVERLQQELDVKMRAAELRWKVDPMILSLAGYHRKNAYMIKHWQEYAAGRFPKDPLLETGRYRSALRSSVCASFERRLIRMPFSVATVSTRPFNCAFNGWPAIATAGAVPAQR